MSAPAVKLDPVNRRIIEILQREGRSPFTSIARELGISEAAVRARVQRLTDAGVLDVVAVTNPLKLGFDVMALVGVQANSDLGHVADVVSEWAETSYVVITSGSYDLLVEVVCEHNRHLLDVVQRLREIDGVKSTETFMYLDMVKMTYAWGTR
jgi:Lrp/AsnC family transcriptional regulator for asnA, asnC and gidA